MKLSESPIQAANAIERIRRLMDAPRSPGLHVSDLILCLRKAKARRDGDMPGPSPSDLLVFTVGRAIQDYITGRSSEVQMTKDGITGSMDYVDEDGAPWEIKATYASALRPIVDNPHYFDQLGAYCHMYGVNKGYLAVFYINGYYDFMRKKPREGQVKGERAVLKVWEVNFTDGELESLWQSLQARGAFINGAETWRDVPLSFHYEWECGYCPLGQSGECEATAAGYVNRWASA